MSSDSIQNGAVAPASNGAPATTGTRIAERGVVVNGLRLATAISDAPRELLAHAPLIVLPAAGHSWGDYRPILERFATERRVFALDWPGFGASAKPAPNEITYSSASYADLIAGWMDNLGIARGVFLGNSVGATAAIRYAAAHPQRVAGLTLVAPGGFTPKGIVRSLASDLLGNATFLRLVEPAFTSLYLGPTTEATRAIVARHRALRKSADATAYFAAYAALWRSFNHADDDLPGIAKQVTAPTLVIRGALDPIITAGDAQRAAEGLGERGGLQVTLPDAGHLPFLQQPQRFSQAVAGLIATAEARALEMA